MKLKTIDWNGKNLWKTTRKERTNDKGLNLSDQARFAVRRSWHRPHLSDGTAGKEVSKTQGDIYNVRGSEVSL